MLPVNMELRCSAIKPMARYIFLTSKCKFGGDYGSDDHILERLNSFVERANDQSIVSDYKKMLADDTTPWSVKQYNNRSTHNTVKFHFDHDNSNDRFSHMLRNDMYTAIHFHTGGKLQKYLIKLMLHLDEESDLDKQYSNHNDPGERSEQHSE